MSYTFVGSPFTGWGSNNLVGREVFLSQIENPTKTILIAEHSDWNWGIHAGNYSSFLNSGASVERGHRHGNYANYLFVDGHVEALELEQVEPFLAGNR